MVELKPKTQTTKVSKPEKPSEIVFWKPKFLGIVLNKQKDQKTSFVVSKWQVTLQVGQFYRHEEEEKVQEQYKPLEEGQTIEKLVVRPSGKFFNLVSFDLGGEEEPEVKDEGSSSEPSLLNPSYLVCLCEDIYPIDKNALIELRKKLNKLSKTKKVRLEDLEDQLLNFQFSNHLNLTFKQLSSGFHFLPVSYVLKLYKAGFVQFSLVHGLVYPNGVFVEFKNKPKDYNTLLEMLRKLGVVECSQRQI
jgi:hypothetical protein